MFLDAMLLRPTCQTTKEERGISPKDLEATRRYLGVIRTTTRDPMVFSNELLPGPDQTRRGGKILSAST